MVHDYVIVYLILWYGILIRDHQAMQIWVGLVETSQLVSRHWRSAASPPSWQICDGLLDPQNAVGGLDGRFIRRTSLVSEKPSWYTALRLGLLRACLRDSWKLKLCVHGFGTRACLDLGTFCCFALCLCDMLRTVLKAMSLNHSGSVLLLAPGRDLPDRDLWPLWVSWSWRLNFCITSDVWNLCKTRLFVHWWGQTSYQV